MFSNTIIMGRITKEPELRKTPAGVSVITFSVAVNRAYAQKEGERKVDFYDVVAWRNNAEFISRYFSKGSAILVEGNMESRTYKDKTGNDRRVWELMASNVSFTGEKRDMHNVEHVTPEIATYTSDKEIFVEVEGTQDLPF